MLSTLEKVCRSWNLSTHKKGPSQSGWNLIIYEVGYEALWAAFACFHECTQSTVPSLNVMIYALSAKPGLPKDSGCNWLWDRLRTSGVLIQPVSACETRLLGPNWPSATRSNVYMCKYEPNASPQRTGQKLWTQSGHVPETRRGLPIATSLWPDGECTGVRSSQVESSEG